MAKITMIGLWNWTDNTLFDRFKIPDGPDKAVLIHRFLDRYGECECLYSNPDYISFIFENWSNVHMYTMEKLWKSASIAYEPLNNYDRTEIDTETVDMTKSGTSGNDTKLETSGNNSESRTDERKTSAFDSVSYSPESYTETGDETSNSGKASANSSANYSDHEGGTRKHETRTFGNIGVTTSQRMLEAERQVSVWSWYDAISDLLAADLVIMVY